MNVIVNGKSLSNTESLKSRKTITSIVVSPAAYRCIKKECTVTISSISTVDIFINSIHTGKYEKVITVYFVMNNPSYDLIKYLIFSLSRICLPEVEFFAFNGITSLPDEFIRVLFFYNNFPKLTYLFYTSNFIVLFV